MDMRPHLQALEDHFAALLVLLATLGYIVIALFSNLDFQQYLQFILFMILAYYVVRFTSVFWLGILVLGIYLFVAYIVPDEYIVRFTRVIRANTDRVMEQMLDDIGEEKIPASPNESQK